MQRMRFMYGTMLYEHCCYILQSLVYGCVIELLVACTNPKNCKLNKSLQRLNVNSCMACVSVMFILDISIILCLF